MVITPVHPVNRACPHRRRLSQLDCELSRSRPFPLAFKALNWQMLAKQGTRHRERQPSATVLSTSARENTVTVAKRDGQTVTYNPQRLRGVTVFETAQRNFATGDRLQCTAPTGSLA